MRAHLNVPRAFAERTADETFRTHAIYAFLLSVPLCIVFSRALFLFLLSLRRETARTWSGKIVADVQRRIRIIKEAGECGGDGAALTAACIIILSPRSATNEKRSRSSTRSSDTI